MLKKFLDLVKGQIGYYDNQISRFSPSHPQYRPAQVELYRRLRADHVDLLAYLEGTTAPAPTLVADAEVIPSPSPSVPSDLADLPPELLAELSETARGEVDTIIQIINERGGTASLDDILIDLYRKHGEIGKRNIVANKLYRLSRRKLCWSVPGKKGVYTTTKPEGADNNDSESDEGPDAATSEPSSADKGAARLPDRPLNPSPGGSTPPASTHLRRKLMSEASTPPLLRRI